MQSAISEAFTEAMSESCSAYYCGSGQSDEMSMDVDVQYAFSEAFAEAMGESCGAYCCGSG